MKYKKPVCDCGKELVFMSQNVVEYEANITKQGNPSKKRILMAEYQQGCDWLWCKDCSIEYEYNTDKKGRIIRSDSGED